MAPIAVTGVPKFGEGPAPPRLEINDFVKNEKHFSLYVQALTELQEKGEDEALSFNKIGGIHGVPVAWNEAPEPLQEEYCLHRTDNFPTWHRPYLALLEQAIYNIAIIRAEEYPEAEREDWKIAAQNLRQPYWDWVVHPVPPAEVLSLKTVRIIKPAGPKDVRNPLYSFKIPESSREHFNAFLKNFEETVRNPGADGNSNIPELILALERTQPQLERGFNALFRLDNWAAFSNTRAGTGGSANSLEGLHNTIHNRVSGHMSDFASAGFDPIFYLHHAQVDRLLSLWSAVHPNVWVPPQSNQALLPFWSAETNPATTFWKSQDVADTANGLNYTYPDFLIPIRIQPIDSAAADSISGGAPTSYEPLPPNEVPQTVYNTLAPVNNLFANYAVQVTKSQVRDGAQAYLAGAADSIGNDATVSVLPYWSVHSTCQQYAYGTSYSVHFFIGQVPGDLTLWYESPDHVGSFDSVVRENTETCKNCKTHLEQQLEVEGFVHLSSTLAKKGLSSLEPEVVEPYLKENLHWGILTAHGKVEPVDSLKVRVAVRPLTQPVGGKLPTIGPATYYDDITANRNSIA